jgi:hypothetical protein
MGEEKEKPQLPPAEQPQQGGSGADSPSSPNGQPGYKPRPADPQLWHWVEKREGPPARN